MAKNLSYTASGNVSITGITPVAGPKPTITVAAAFNSGATDADDNLTETYTVNAGTTATAIDLGYIATGLLVSINTTGPLLVTITQDQGSGPVDVTWKVDTFLLLESGFTALQLANAGGTAVNVSLTVIGNRIPLGTGPGIF